MALAAAGWAHADVPTPAQDAVRATIARVAPPDSHRSSSAGQRRALEDFYASRAHLPAWFVEGQAQTDVAVALAALTAAPAHGLVAADYDAEWLAHELEAIATTGDRSVRRLARADVALTLAMLRYLSDLHGGRVPPRQIGFALGSADPAFDAAAVLARALAEHRVHETVAAAVPSFAIYARLKAVLVRYRELASRPLPALPPLPPGTTKIEPGERYAGTAALVARLALVGDLPPTAALPPADRYAGALVDAVRSFQGRHGLVQDGIIGKATLAQLEMPLAQRVRQIELAMERLRWVPRLAPGPVIVVNIPSYALWAFDGRSAPGVPALTMRVIVGRSARDMQTPIFIGRMRFVEFSPYWNVPPTIQTNELVPRLARDPDDLVREEMEIVGPDRDAPPHTSLDPTALAALRDGTARIRQRPGPKNALGGIKFVLPNTMSIYLHGTPAGELFGRARRDFSHGCIRVADPLALAQFVLRDRPDWTEERMREAMVMPTTSSVSLSRAVPVVIFYTTATVDTEGRVQFLPDVYDYDRKLEAALRRRDAAARAERGTMARPWAATALPAPHAPGVDVEEIGRRVVTDPAGVEGMRGVAQIRQRNVGKTDVDGAALQVEAVRGDAAAVLLQHAIGGR